MRYEHYLAAGVPHGQDLQQVGGAEHALHVVLGDGDLPGVGVVQEPGDHARLHPVQGDHVLDRLGEAGCEHGLPTVNSENFTVCDWLILY